MDITDEIIEEFKERMHLTGSYEDNNLRRILSASVKALRGSCGDYEISNEEFKELVFERSRYAYNDALEYFEDNFLHRINKLALDKALEKIELKEGDTNEEV